MVAHRKAANYGHLYSPSNGSIDQQAKNRSTKIKQAGSRPAFTSLTRTRHQSSSDKKIMFKLTGTRKKLTCLRIILVVYHYAILTATYDRD